MAEWQPIETAPTDGTPILLRLGKMVATGQFGKYHPWGLYLRDGFYFDGATLPSEATHWQPLPDPPP